MSWALSLPVGSVRDLPDRDAKSNDLALKCQISKDFRVHVDPCKSSTTVFDFDCWYPPTITNFGKKTTQSNSYIVISDVL